MVSKLPYTLRFAPEVVNHLRTIERKYHPLIRKTIDEQLKLTPTIATRNRKLLHQPSPFGASWELRFGPDNRFRVFYDVNIDEKIILILAVGEKQGNRLIVSNQEYTP